MAALGNYYIDAPILSGATSVFTNVGMTTLAADGFYSDQLGTVREQVSGILGISIACPTCYIPCGTSIDISGGGLTQGIYDMKSNTPTTSGCIIVYVKPYSTDIGVRVAFDSVLYNQMTNATYGYLASNNASNYTYIGDSTLASPCGTNIGVVLDGSGYSGLNQWEYSGAGFALVGASGVVTGTSGDLALTAADPGYCTLYIPKPLETSGVVDASIFGPCPLIGIEFDIQVNCPVTLVSVWGSNPGPYPDCNIEALPNLFYNVPNFGGTAGVPALHEFMLLDPYGVNRVAPGDYVIDVAGALKEITISADGIITAIAACPP
jgi:hypothetical protein